MTEQGFQKILPRLMVGTATPTDINAVAQTIIGIAGGDLNVCRAWLRDIYPEWYEDDTLKSVANEWRRLSRRLSHVWHRNRRQWK